MNREVRIVTVMYTEEQFYQDGELVNEERWHDDREYEVQETREPTEDEINEYYPEEAE